VPRGERQDGGDGDDKPRDNRGNQNGGQEPFPSIPLPPDFIGGGDNGGTTDGGGSNGNGNGNMHGNQSGGWWED
jgi:hypothetical protein